MSVILPESTNSPAASPSTPMPLIADAGERLAACVAATVEEDGGCWSACSGCQESEDGYVSTKYYPYSPIFRCQPGSGCRECGGIGVVWQDGAFLASFGEALSTPVTLDNTAALTDVAAERARQVEKLGWTAEHDDTHDNDRALSRAAACYALANPLSGDTGPFWVTHLHTPSQVWPYRWEWKPKDRRTNLVRAAALLIAEIERFDRATFTAKTRTAE